jgi:hypothetical protein
MSFIHHDSTNASKSELDLFVVPPTQTAVENSYVVKYKPISSLDSTKVLEFSIPASEDFIDLNDIYLHVRAKVTAGDGSNLVTGNTSNTDDERIKPSMYLLFSMFQGLEVAVGSELVTQASNTYHYRAYFDALTEKNMLNKITHSCPAAWLDDVERKNIAKDSRIIDLYGKLHGDVFQQSRLLLNLVPISLRLTKSRDEFALEVIGSDGKTRDPILKFIDASLFVGKAKLYPDAEAGIAFALEKSPARYFIERKEVKTFNIPAGQTSYSLDNIYNGQLPKIIYVSFIPNSAFTGTYDSDPFIFNNMNLNSIVAFVDGRMVPNIPYTPDYDNDCYAREYYSLFEQSNQNNNNVNFTCSYAQFKSKHCMYSFNLSPDKNVNIDKGSLSLLKRGSIRIEFGFKTAPTVPLTMLAYACYDSLIEIDRSRNVTKDY